jgi:hypothetical protein
MERNNAWLRELIGRLSMARVLSVSDPPLVLKHGRGCRQAEKCREQEAGDVSRKPSGRKAATVGGLFQSVPGAGCRSRIPVWLDHSVKSASPVLICIPAMNQATTFESRLVYDPPNYTEGLDGILIVRKPNSKGELQFETWC